MSKVARRHPFKVVFLSIMQGAGSLEKVLDLVLLLGCLGMSKQVASQPWDLQSCHLVVLLSTLHRLSTSFLSVSSA